MFLYHHKQKFEARDVWFLQSLNSKEPEKMFNNRILLIGKCPICKREVVRLVETRVFDNQEFAQTFIGYKAEKVMQNEKKRILYTQNTCPKGILKSFVFGENTEVHCRKRKGEKVGRVRAIRQRACDWNNQKVLIKEVKVNNEKNE